MLMQDNSFRILSQKQDTDIAGDSGCDGDLDAAVRGRAQHILRHLQADFWPLEGRRMCWGEWCAGALQEAEQSS